MRILVLGSTGAIGAEIIRQALLDVRIGEVLALSRRKLNFEHPKLRVVLLADFNDHSSVAAELTAVDVCCCALGVSQTEVGDEKLYYTITHDYVLAAARALTGKNPAARFLFVSGMGTDPAGKSRVMWARVKGQTEMDLRALLGKKLVIFRPGYVYPIHRRDKALLLDTLSRPLYWFRALLPTLVTDTVEVARAMLAVAHGISDLSILKNREIRRAAKAVS